MNLIKKFLFLDSINNYVSRNISKIKDISIVVLINPHKLNNQIKNNNFYKIINFCKGNKLPFFVSDDYKLAVKTKANGIYLKSSNKRMIFNNFEKKIITIGTAHNQLEYYFKKKQNCSLIFLSPIFITKKHSINKALGPVKFNLITSAWKVKFGCLGGLTANNLKKTRLTFASSIGFQSLIYDKQKKTRLL